MSAHFAIEEGALRRLVPPFAEHASRRLLLQLEVFVRELKRAHLPVPLEHVCAALKPFVHAQTPETFLAASVSLGATGRALLMDGSLDIQRQRLLRTRCTRQP